MNNLERWNQLSREEKLALQLRQVEWVLFQASIKGMILTPGSLGAVVESRRALCIKRSTHRLGNAMSTAKKAFDGAGGWETLWEQKEINKQTLSFACYYLARGVLLYIDGSITDDLTLVDMTTYYLRSLGPLGL